MCLNLAKIGLSIINWGFLSLKASQAKLRFDKLLRAKDLKAQTFVNVNLDIYRIVTVVAKSLSTMWYSLLSFLGCAHDKMETRLKSVIVTERCIKTDKDVAKMLHKFRPNRLKNVNSNFYEYLRVQTDNNKLHIPEILLRGQLIDLFFVV